MAENLTNTVNPILSVCATTSSKVKELIIKDGQLIFIHDTNKIALDLNGKRTFYNQITELESEAERQSLLAPLTKHYYFVVETAVLWTYNGGWIQITSKPEEIVFIGTELPELGVPKTLYVNKTEQNITVWDDDTSKYITVGEAYQSMNTDDIDAMFPA